MVVTRVKICCISSLEEAALAIRYGASAVGLVGKMPSGPGVIGDELIREIAVTIPPGVSSFLLTSETDAQLILDHHHKTRTNTIQLVDYVEHHVYDELRKQIPAVKLVQVIHVLDEGDLTRAKRIAPFVDALLLDSGNPTLGIKLLGGTGQVHNWEISRQIREAVKVPVYLAGGLGPHNVRAAIDTVEPFGVDLCSSVRTNGQLDETKLAAFFEAVNS